MARLAAGFGEVIVTPPLGVELSGYGFYLDRRAVSVLDELKARALYLETGGRKALLISCDLVGFTVAVAGDIRDKVSKAVAVPRQNILLACTHTHTGPATVPLAGIGDVDPGYMAALPADICEAATKAVADAAEAAFSYAFEALEPIGYNRRNATFDDIDPWLKTAFFERRTQDILLLSYACHPVILGRSTQVSADWPGAAVRAVEAAGRKALVLQGFCGDIDPVTQLNRWGEGTPDDMALYGRIVADRARKSRCYAKTPAGVRIKTAERRIRVPLAVPPVEKIDAAAALFLEKNSGFPGADRFAEEWKATARARHAGLAEEPYIDGVPIQAVDIGGLAILGLPGEVFSRFGLGLKKKRASLVPVGYANGDIGYIPERQAFADPGDYACYCAPMFYTVFPFTPDIEDIITDASLGVLRDLER